MATVYALWSVAGEYEGADVLLGLYSSESEARVLGNFYMVEHQDEDTYITRIELDQRPGNSWACSLGEVLEEV